MAEMTEVGRTHEKFVKAWNDVKWWVKFHNKPVWLVPTADTYALSIIAPTPDTLPAGTASLKYGPNPDNSAEPVELDRIVSIVRA